MTKDEALKLALEALEGVLDDSPKVLDASIAGGLYEVVQCRDAITAIKEALAQPEQEPVATVTSETGADISMSWWHEPALPVGTKLYTTPPQRKPQIWEHEGYDALCQELELWKAEAQRKPLTDEEIHEAVRESDLDWHQGWMLDDDEPNRFISLARAIEAAHNIKGEA